MRTKFWASKLKIRPLVRPRCRLTDNFKMCLKYVEWEGADWLNVA
jgi:hypothetical protein